MDAKRFAYRLRDLRRLANITGKELADILGVTKTAISYWENEVNYPNQDTLNNLARYFNVTTDYLLGLSDVPSPSKRREEPQQNQQPQDEFLVAFYDSAQKLSDDAKNDVLRFMEFLKEKEKMEKK